MAKSINKLRLGYIKHNSFSWGSDSAIFEDKQPSLARIHETPCLRCLLVFLYPVLAPCQDNSCLHDGTCVASANGSTCLCHKHFEGDKCESEYQQPLVVLVCFRCDVHCICFPDEYKNVHLHCAYISEYIYLLIQTESP